MVANALSILLLNIHRTVAYGILYRAKCEPQVTGRDEMQLLVLLGIRSRMVGLILRHVLFAGRMITVTPTRKLKVESNVDSIHY